VLDEIYRYHDGTKHHFHGLARSLGYLDWASQPNPFRSFHGAAAVSLRPRPDALAATAAVGAILRHSLGISAWKRDAWAGWPLRVNPSSGNLHPTEAYVVAGPMAGVTGQSALFHYASDRHALEQRCAFDAASWREAVPSSHATLLVALTSIHWRESWKYGERAFRYCQHDLGHAVAAVSLAAALEGWRARVLGDWSHREIAALVGADRDDDYLEAEREEPGCVLTLTAEASAGGEPPLVARDVLLAGLSRGTWSGRASRLSEDHVQWTFIDEIAAATEDPGRARPALPAPPAVPAPPAFPARVILQRRSALALDPRSSIDSERFFGILAATVPSSAAPWSALWWDARIHLAVFVHRVEGLEPGLYLLVRDASAEERLKAAMRSDFLWVRAHDRLPLFQLARGDCRSLAGRLSCDQSIAADGFFSLGMLADFDASLREHGPSFYRHLFWESGVIGQVLYLAAEAGGARGTGIGCFYDDPVHDVLGIADHAFQSLYHFAIGTPVDDPRVTSEPGYAWESST
jgi:SagB-type dehydrogenase family enzyme